MKETKKFNWIDGEGIKYLNDPTEFHEREYIWIYSLFFFFMGLLIGYIIWGF